MTYIELITNILKDKKCGEPIYTADIATVLADEFQLEINKAKAAVAVAMKRILNEKIYSDLRAYQKGIYYFSEATPFGEVGINKEKLIQHKYLLNDIGYETGYTVLHIWGLTTQIPNERVFATNKAKGCIREDRNLGVYIRPPKTTVTAKNKMYLQLLDVIELMDKAPVDADKPYDILAEHLNKNNMKYGDLLAIADRYYNKNTIIQLAHIASAGGINV